VTLVDARKLLFVALLWFVAGCATVRIAKPDEWTPAVEPRERWVGGSGAHTVASPATDFQSRTVWVLWWGWNQENLWPANCLGNGLAEVRVRTNLVFEFISVATLGFVQPITIEWECAKRPQTDVKDF
jgi:hypothetical protein